MSFLKEIFEYFFYMFLGAIFWIALCIVVGFVLVEIFNPFLEPFFIRVKRNFFKSDAPSDWRVFKSEEFPPNQRRIFVYLKVGIFTFLALCGLFFVLVALLGVVSLFYTLFK